MTEEEAIEAMVFATAQIMASENGDDLTEAEYEKAKAEDPQSYNEFKLLMRAALSAARPYIEGRVEAENQACEAAALEGSEAASKVNKNDHERYWAAGRSDAARAIAARRQRGGVNHAGTT